MDENRFVPETMLLLVNPIAGKGRGLRAAPMIRSHLEELGIHTRIRETGTKDALNEIFRKEARGIDAVAAAGGDGTVRLAAAAMIESGIDIPLGIFPLGLSNCLARDLHLPFDLKECCRVFNRGRCRRVSGFMVNNRLSLAFVGAGLDGEIVFRVARQRHGPLRQFAYVAAAVFSLGAWGVPDLKVRVDGEELDGSFFQVLTGAISNYARYFTMADKNRAELFCFEGARRRDALISLVRLLPDLDLGRAAKIRRSSFSSLRITSSSGRIRYQYDGESGEADELDIKTQPDVIRVYH